MAPLNNAFHDNPIFLKTRKAMRVIGGLIDEWSTNPKSHPPTSRTEADGRFIVFAADDFRALLEALPEADRLDSRDVTLRQSITEIELILRRPDRFSILLPEPAAMEHHHALAANGEMPGVMLTTLYRDVGQEALDGGFPMNLDDVNEAGEATYQVLVAGQNPLDAFLRPYLAAYCCTQCT